MMPKVSAPRHAKGPACYVARRARESEVMSRGANNSVREQVIVHLTQIVGLLLAATRRAADMRTLQFGTLRPVKRGSVGDFALHIQCPWRVEGPDGIVTGRMDLCEPVEQGPDFDFDSWDYEKSPNLQDSQFDQLLARHGTGLVVESVDADDYGGAAIRFANSFVLRLFPAGTRGEDWRLFRPQAGEPHFIIAEGKVDVGEGEPAA